MNWKEILKCTKYKWLKLNNWKIEQKVNYQISLRISSSGYLLYSFRSDYRVRAELTSISSWVILIDSYVSKRSFHLIVVNVEFRVSKISSKLELIISDSFIFKIAKASLNHDTDNKNIFYFIYKTIWQQFFSV